MKFLQKNIEVSTNADFVHLKITGKLEVENYSFFMPILEKQLESYGTLTLLIELYDFHGWTLCAAWKDTKFGIHHFRDVHRIAL